MHPASRIVAPSLIVKAEAIVAPNQLVAYLGRGAHAGRVSDIAYHNSLMVQIWSALAASDARLMTWRCRGSRASRATTGWATAVHCQRAIS